MHAVHSHLIEDYLCEQPLYEELHFQAHQHSFDTTWDLTPPESPVRIHGEDQCAYDGDFSRVTVNLQQRDFSPCQDLASVMWNNGGGAFEVRGEWTAPPSPVEFDELTDMCNEIESYPSFELDHEAALLCKASQIPFIEAATHTTGKRKANAPIKMVSKTKANGGILKPVAGRQRTGSTARRTDLSPSPSMESDDPESKRHTHNVLERKRRNELKSSYQELREEIPDLNDNDKTPTGVILNRACEYIIALQEEETALLQAIAAAKFENARLRRLYV